MDSIIVAIIMIGMIVAFVIGAVIATKKGNSGFISAVKYKESESKNRESGKRG